MDYQIIIGKIDTDGPRTLAVELPADAFMDGMDDPRYPAPAGFQWGEGLLLDGIQIVALEHLCGEPAVIE